MDQSTKTRRQFFCRDVLWDVFERMANDFDCSIDYLINEGMRAYAHSKGYGATTGAATTDGAPPQAAAPQEAYPGGAAPARQLTTPQPLPNSETMDQSTKRRRQFFCRDVLWDVFERMANDFDCSIDYLINEGMRAYARSKDYHADV